MAALRTSIALIASLGLLAACGDDDMNTTGTAGANGVGTGSGYDSAGNVIPGSQADLETTVGDRVYYATDSSRLDGEAQGTLQQQATWLKQYGDVDIVVEGHADERGTREYNLALGERRANSAKNYLVSLGVSPSRVTTISYGKERPAVIGSNQSAWAQNRRAVTVIVGR